MQPEVEFEERELVISRWLVATIAFAVAWLALGLYAVHHPDVQRALMRTVPMSLAAQAEFNVRRFWLTLPVSPAILATAAAAMVWVAFLRAEWSDQMLFCAAAILMSTVLLGGTEAIFQMASGRFYGSTIVTAGVTTYLLCALLAQRARRIEWLIVSVSAALYAVVFPYYARYGSVLDVVGGVLFAGAVLCLSFFIAERAGVEPFAATE